MALHSILIDVTSYAQVIKLVLPGNAEASVLYSTVVNSEPTDRMPIYPVPSWDPEKIRLIKKWINQGALNNRCNENYENCDTSDITYTNFIQPLFSQDCQGCHVQGSWGGGITFNSYDEIKASAQTGRMLQALKWAAGYHSMPKFGSKLSDCYFHKIEQWIGAGMPE